MKLEAKGQFLPVLWIIVSGFQGKGRCGIGKSRKEMERDPKVSFCHLLSCAALGKFLDSSEGHFLIC